METQQRRKEKCSGWLLQEKQEHSDCLLQEEKENVLGQLDVSDFYGTLSLSNVGNIGPWV